MYRILEQEGESGERRDQLVHPAYHMAGGAVWGTPGNNGGSALLGYTSQETCFLSGITGSLVGNQDFGGSDLLLHRLARSSTSNRRADVRSFS
jgi:hypothetical protein